MECLTELLSHIRSDLIMNEDIPAIYHLMVVLVELYKLTIFFLLKADCSKVSIVLLVCEPY